MVTFITAPRPRCCSEPLGCRRLPRSPEQRPLPQTSATARPRGEGAVHSAAGLPGGTTRRCHPRRSPQHRGGRRLPAPAPAPRTAPAPAPAPPRCSPRRARPAWRWAPPTPPGCLFAAAARGRAGGCCCSPGGSPPAPSGCHSPRLQIATLFHSCGTG